MNIKVFNFVLLKKLPTVWLHRLTHEKSDIYTVSQWCSFEFLIIQVGIK